VDAFEPSRSALFVAYLTRLLTYTSNVSPLADPPTCAKFPHTPGAGTSGPIGLRDLISLP
jgi:hypothetical protein